MSPSYAWLDNDLLGIHHMEKLPLRVQQGKVRIAYIDTGCNIDDPFFQSAKILSVDMNGESAADQVGHGTFVGSVMTRLLDQYSWHPIEVIAIRAGNSPSLPTESICRGIERAIKLNVDVLSIEACNLFFHPRMAMLVTAAVSRGIIVIAPAGNFLKEQTTFPASLKRVISCGSYEQAGLAEHSNYNRDLDVLAPGYLIPGRLAEPVARQMGLSKDGNGLCHLSGTSFAAAILSVLAALVKSVDKQIGAAEFRDLLDKSLTRRTEIAVSIGASLNVPLLRFDDVFTYMSRLPAQRSAAPVKIYDTKVYWEVRCTPAHRWLQLGLESYESDGTAVRLNVSLQMKLLYIDPSEDPSVVCSTSVEVSKGVANIELPLPAYGRYRVLLVDPRQKEPLNNTLFWHRPAKPVVTEVSMGDNTCLLLKVKALHPELDIYYRLGDTRIEVDPSLGPVHETFAIQKDEAVALTREDGRGNFVCYCDGMFSDILVIDYEIERRRLADASGP
ncbi:S8 family peptidase [Paenibacillus forsythiae]|nr:S8/S53 family peptidase [Paenibacillus forsythiae]